MSYDRLTMDSQLRVELELAGVRTDRAIAVAAWARPEECTRERGSLVWTGDRTIKTFPTRVTDLALRFADLHQSGVDDAQPIVDFARRFGPLYLCSHELPMTHLSPAAIRHIAADMPLSESRVDDYLASTGFGDDHVIELVRGRWSEPVNGWRHWSEAAELMLQLIAAYHQKRQLEVSFWRRLDRWLSAHSLDIEYRFLRNDSGGDDQPTRSWLAVEVGMTMLIEHWLEWAGMRVTVRLQGEAPTLELATGSLFGAVTAELVAAIVGWNDVEVCVNCQRPFRRDGPDQRRTQHGKNSYCSLPNCRRAISRDSKRRRRAARTNVGH